MVNGGSKDDDDDNDDDGRKTSRTAGELLQNTRTFFSELSLLTHEREADVDQCHHA